MSDYFDPNVNRIAAGSLVRSAQVNALRDDTSVAFDKLPTEPDLKLSTTTYAVDTGIADAYVITLDYALTAYVDGMEVVFKPANDNTGASTINVNSLGAKGIKSPTGVDLLASDLTVGNPVVLRYDGTNFRFTGGSPISSLVIAAADAAAAAASATAAETAQTAAELAETNAETAETNAAASASAAAADAVDTAADLVATNQDTIDTAADLVATNQDTIDTAADAVDTAADLVATNQDTIDTAADLVATNQDTIDTAADVVSAAASASDASDSADEAAASAASLVTVDNMFGLVGITGQTDGSTARMLGFFVTFPQLKFIGGGKFAWQADLAKSNANGGTIIDPDNIGGFDGTVSTRDAFLAAQGGGAGNGCWVRINNNNVLVTYFGATGLGVDDDNNAIHAVRDYVAGLTDPLEVVFPEGTYLYSISPNWAIQNLVVTFEGVVRLRYTGTGNAVIIDTGASGNTFNVQFGWGNKPLVEAPSTAAHGVYLRSVHHSKIAANVRGCGTSSHAFNFEFSVLSEFDCVISVNEGAFYSSGVPLRGLFLTERNSGEQVSACIFYNPVVEGVSATGIVLDQAIQNTFIGGTSEANVTGIDIREDCDNNSFQGLDLENNSSGTGLIDRGSFNTFNDLLNDALTTITSTARGSKFNGGNVDDISDLGTGTKLHGINYSNSGGAITAGGTGLEKIGVFNITTASYDDNDLATLKIAAGTAIKKHLHSSIVAGAFAVPAAVPGVSVKTGLTVTGVVVGDTVVISSTTVLASNYSMYGIVISANTVEIRVHQYTGAATSPFPSGTTLKIDVWGH